MDFNQSWVIDATWAPPFVDEVKCNTFGLWKIRIMNGVIWMENKQTSQKQGTCRNFVILLWEFPSITIFSGGKYFENTVKIILWKNFHNRIYN